MNTKVVSVADFTNIGNTILEKEGDIRVIFRFFKEYYKNNDTTKLIIHPCGKDQGVEKGSAYEVHSLADNATYLVLIRRAKMNLREYKDTKLIVIEGFCSHLASRFGFWHSSTVEKNGVIFVSYTSGHTIEMHRENEPLVLLIECNRAT